MQSAVFYLVALLFVVVSGAPYEDERIVQGTPVPTLSPDRAHDYPFLVSITQDGNHFCGGFIYNSRYVVTTASCLERKTISLLTVIAGQYNLIEIDGNEQSISAFNVIFFDYYVSGNKTHDIALIELASDLDLNGKFVDFAEFNEVNIDATFTPQGLVMGWGTNTLGGGVSSKLRYTTTIMTETKVDCASYSQNQFGIATMICGNPDDSSGAITSSSPCTYDEGSPLVQKYTTNDTPPVEKTIVVGVLSQYSSTCDKTIPSVYTRISVYYAWLNKVAGPQPTRP